MKQFQNLAEAVAYHRKCYLCGDRLVHPFQIDYDPEKPPVFKWNLSENVDSDTDDWLTVDAYTNQISYHSQHRRHNYDLIYSGNDLVDLVGRRAGNYKLYKGTLYESVFIDCGKCHQFGYVLQVIINATAKRLDAIFLNSEHISYQDSDKVLHEIRNVYTTDKTEYVYHRTPTPEDDSSKRTITLPIIPLDLHNPAETVARVKKLTVFS